MASSSSNSYKPCLSKVRFRNAICDCGARAEVRISESKKNPNKLYYCCAMGRCKFWDWCVEEFDGNTKEAQVLHEDHKVADRLKYLDANLSHGNTMLLGICIILVFIAASVLGILIKM